MASLTLIQQPKPQIWAPSPKKEVSFQCYDPKRYRPLPGERPYGKDSLTKTATVKVKEVFDRIRRCDEELDKYGNVIEIGKGTFGRVFRVIKHPDLILKVQNTIEMKRRLIAEKEEAMLRRVKDVSDLPQLIHAFGTKHFHYVVMRYEGENLLGKKYNLESLALIAIQWVKGLRNLHSRNIAHLDIKPSNLAQKLIDLGGAREIPEGGLLCNAGTLGYKAPEIMMRSHLGLSADMWSLGCTLFELYTGKRFIPLETEGPDWQIVVNMLHACQSRLGSIPTNLRGRDFYTIDKDGRKNLKPDTNRFSLDSLGRVIRLNKRGDDSGPRLEEFVDLLTRMLQFNPTQRISAEETLKHPFFTRSFEITSNRIVLQIRVRSASGAVLQTIPANEKPKIQCLLTDFPIRLEYYHPEKPEITITRRIIR